MVNHSRQTAAPCVYRALGSYSAKSHAYLWQTEFKTEDNTSALWRDRRKDRRGRRNTVYAEIGKVSHTSHLAQGLGLGWGMGGTEVPFDHLGSHMGDRHPCRHHAEVLGRVWSQLAARQVAPAPQLRGRTENHRTTASLNAATGPLPGLSVPICACSGTHVGCVCISVEGWHQWYPHAGHSLRDSHGQIVLQQYPSGHSNPGRDSGSPGVHGSRVSVASEAQSQILPWTWPAP